MMRRNRTKTSVRDLQTLPITNSDLISAYILFCTHVKVGEIICQMMSGAGIMIPRGIGGHVRRCEVSSRIRRITVIYMIKPMIAFCCSVSNFMANLTHRTIFKVIARIMTLR